MSTNLIFNNNTEDNTSLKFKSNTIRELFNSNNSSSLSLEKNLSLYFKACSLFDLEKSENYSNLILSVINQDKQSEERKENIKFLLFWYPFLNNFDEQAEKILKNMKIFFKKQEIPKEIIGFNSTTEEMNTEVFRIVNSLKFTNEIKYIVIKSGKILFELEYILNLIEDKQNEEIEVIVNSQNFCYFGSQVLKAKFKSFIDNHIDNVLYNHNSNYNYDNQYSNDKQLKSHKSVSKFSNFNNKNSSFQGIVTKPSINIRKYEILDENLNILLENNKSNLNLSLLIIMTCLNNKGIYIKINQIRRFILFDKEKKYSYEILLGIYISNLRNLTVECLESNLITPSLKVFLLALKYKDMKFLIIFHQLYKDMTILTSTEIHQEIINHLKLDPGNMQIYIFFIKNTLKFFHLRTAKHFIKVIDEMLTFNSCDILIYSISNQIMILVLISEVLQIMKDNFQTLTFQFNRLQLKSLSICEDIQNNIDDDTLFREIMLEKDLSDRALIEIISENSFLKLLKNDLITKVIDDQWNGMYDLTGDFMETSSAYQSMKVSIATKDYDVYSNLRKKEVFRCFWTQFVIWNKHIQSKYLFELLVFLICLVFVQVLNIRCLDEYKSIMSLSEKDLFYFNDVWNRSFTMNYTMKENMNLYYNIKSNSSSNLSIELDYISSNISMIYENYKSIQVSIENYKIFMILFTILPIGYIPRIIYSIKYRSTKISHSYMIDLSITIISIFMFFYISTDSLKESLFSFTDSHEKNDLHSFNFNITSMTSELYTIISIDSLGILFTLLSVYCLFFWFKFILLLKNSRQLGPLIVTFILSFKGIVTYLFSFLFINLIFSLFGMMNFYNVSFYFNRNIFMSFIYYFLVSLGSHESFDIYFSNDKYQSKSYMSYLGGVFIIILNIVNTVIVFNVMIALLANIYENFRVNAIQLYIRERIEIRKLYYIHDKRYNSLLKATFPVNILIIPFSFAYLFKLNDGSLCKLNRIINNFTFFFYLIVYLTVYCFVGVILIPVIYIKIVFSKIVSLFISDIQEYMFIYKLIVLIIYIILGIFIQFFYFLKEIKVFLVYIYYNPTVKLFNNEEKGRFIVNVEILNSLIKYNTHLLVSNSNTNPIENIEILNYLSEFCRYLELKDKEKFVFFHKEHQQRRQSLLINNEYSEYNEYNDIIKGLDQRFFKFEVETDDILLFLSNFTIENYVNLRKIYFTIGTKVKSDEIFEYYCNYINKNNFKFEFYLKKFIRKANKSEEDKENQGNDKENEGNDDEKGNKKSISSKKNKKKLNFINAFKKILNKNIEKAATHYKKQATTIQIVPFHVLCRLFQNDDLYLNNIQNQNDNGLFKGNTNTNANTINKNTETLRRKSILSNNLNFGKKEEEDKENESSNLIIEEKENSLLSRKNTDSKLIDENKNQSSFFKHLNNFIKKEK